MNAVAATTNSDPGFLAAATPSSAPSPAQGGFVDLINVLLGSQEPVLSTDTNTVPVDSQDISAEPVNTRSSSEIADALIRSMLGSPLTASNLFNDREPAQPGTTKERQPAQDSGNLVPVPGLTPVLPVTVPALPITAPIPPPSDANTSQTLRSTVQTIATKPKTNSLLGNGTLLTNPGVLAPDSKVVASKAELAFALRLTPVETPAESAPAALPATPVIPAVPSEAPQNAVPTVIDNSPAPQEPRTQAKDDSSPKNLFTSSSAPTQHQSADQGQDAVTAVAAPSAADDHSSDFGRSLPNPVPVPVSSRNTEPLRTIPAQNAEQALRTSESAAPLASAAKGPTAQHITVRIAGPESSAVDLQVIERAGQVHVSVRTANTGLQSSLRQDVGTLVNSLERTGYRAETLTHDTTSLTAVAAQTAGASHMDARNNGQGSGQNDRGSQQDRSSHGGSRDRQNHSGSGQQQQRRQQNNWIDTLEKTQ